MTRHGFEEVKGSKLAIAQNLYPSTEGAKPPSINRRLLPYRKEATRWVSLRIKPLGYVYTIAIACAEKAKR